MRNSLLSLFLVISLSGCASLPESFQTFSKVALDRAQTISSALSLRDSYIELEKQIRLNSDAFTEDELLALENESQKVSTFYLQVLSLSRGGSAETMLVNADDFLTSVLTVRSSIDSAILIIKPKLQSLDQDGSFAAADFISNYKHFSLRLDLLLAKNNRREAVQMTATFLKSAIPVITSFLR